MSPFTADKLPENQKSKFIWPYLILWLITYCDRFCIVPSNHVITSGSVFTNFHPDSASSPTRDRARAPVNPLIPEGCVTYVR